MIPWFIRMAWRDSRGSRRRLLLYLSSMMIGVAALVAISGFGNNIDTTIANEGRAILGADLALERNSDFSSETESLLDTLDAEISRRVSLNSMVYFSTSDGARLSRVRAVDGAFPLVGALETDPDDAAERFREEGKALVDATLMSQFEVEVGDTVQIGGHSYPIAGQLLSSAQESGVVSVVSPRVYVAEGSLDEDLFAEGSRVTYEIFLTFEGEEWSSSEIDELATTLREQDVRVTTAAEASSTWQEVLATVAQFMNLVGLAALLLGSIGVASAVHVYIQQRLSQVAVLRCLGASSGRTFRIYLAQAVGMGIVCASIGSGLGVGVQWLLPRLLEEFLPVSVQFSLSWDALGLGLAVGVGVTFLFALLPLLSVRRVSPLLALRSDVEPIARWKDPWVWMTVGVIIIGLGAFAISLAPNLRIGAAYLVGLLTVFALLTATGWILAKGSRWLPTHGWPFSIRQGLANLYRPNNQTTVLMLSIGMGTFIIAVLLLVQATILHQLDMSGGGPDRPSLVLFDVQADQVEEVSQIVRDAGLPVLDEVPIVTMRLRSVEGQSVREMRDDTTTTLTWAHRREYRSTYRSHLTDAEQVVAGTFSGAPHDGDGPVPISMESDVAEELGLTVGDSLEFDVQGVVIDAFVGSLREVDWQRLQTNFFVVFPPGVLESAPTTYIVLSRAEVNQQSATAQRQVAEAFPNVSAIDLALVLSVVDALFDRIRQVVQFLAFLTILTGIIVLAASVVVSRFRRAEESVLLKTLGASRNQVLLVMLAEYALLGLLAAVAALFLALLGAYLMVEFVLNAEFVVPIASVVGLLIVVPILTAGIGWLNSRSIYDRSVLDVLRAEV